jgi:hypothetical protein
MAAAEVGNRLLGYLDLGLCHVHLLFKLWKSTSTRVYFVLRQSVDFTSFMPVFSVDTGSPRPGATTFGARVFYKIRRSFMRRDDAYLLDILIAARKALAFVADMTREAFEISELHQNAVIRTLETIGEAARLVSQPTRDAHPEIP